MVLLLVIKFFKTLKILPMESKFIENLFCRFFGKFSSSYRKVVDTAIASYNLCIWNWLENVHLVFWTRFYPILTHFWLMFQFLHPLKTPENQRFSTGLSIFLFIVNLFQRKCSPAHFLPSFEDSPNMMQIASFYFKLKFSVKKLKGLQW